MNYEEAKQRCHVRSAIYREASPTVRYWKNHTVPLDDRVSNSDKSETDWLEFDPRENSFEALA